MSQAKSKKKKLGKIKPLIAATTIAGLAYFGNAFDAKNTVDHYVGKVNDEVVDVFTYDIGERARDLNKMISKEKDISKYSGDLQSLMKNTTEKMHPYDQMQTLDSIIQEADQNVQEVITSKSFNRQSDAYKDKFAKDLAKSYLTKGKKSVERTINDAVDKLKELYGDVRKRVDNYVK